MQILPFTEENFALALSNEWTSPELIQGKNHFRYLTRYLGDTGIKAKAIVIEDQYISKDYLQDYASYYAFCFQNYSKYCKRVHFFDVELSCAVVEDALLKQEVDCADFWSHYLGFIVVKPIPVTVIGYTVLKTYSNTPASTFRNFWGTRSYNIHLFGNEVKIDSLAFQEQDSVLAACATTAIWSMLNKASVDFHTILKSPSEITKDADTIALDGSRLFPNRGLNLLQICQAIFNSGLVSEIKQPDYPVYDESGNEEFRVVSCKYLKQIITAYSAIGIPLILIIRVPNGGQHGLHAITVSGFKQSPPFGVEVQDSISWLSDNVEKFYAHDDQWGPFTRVEFISDHELDTPWTSFREDKFPTYVTNVVVPLYPKIRISYEDIEVIVLGLDRILSLFFDGNIKYDLVWEIRIDYSENFKKATKNSPLSRAQKLSINAKSHPKYIWIASCFTGEHKLFDFTFDATDVSNGMIGREVICYFSDVIPVLHDFLQKNEHLLKSLFGHRASTNYYRHLLTKLNS